MAKFVLKVPKPAESPPKALRVRKGTGVANGAPEAKRRASGAQSKPAKVKGERPRFGGTLDTMPGGAGGGLWQIKGDMTIQFLSEPQPTDECPDNASMWWYQQWWDDNGNSRILEAGESHPSGTRLTQRFAAAVIDYTENANADQVKYLTLPVSLKEKITKHYARFGTVCESLVYVSRSGTGRMNTKYDIEWGREDAPVTGRKLAKLRSEINVGQALEQEAERLASLELKTARATTADDLLAMDLKELVLMAKGLGITTSGRKRSAISADVLEALNKT